MDLEPSAKARDYGAGTRDGEQGRTADRAERTDSREGEQLGAVSSAGGDESVCGADYAEYHAEGRAGGVGECGPDDERVCVYAESQETGAESVEVH